MFTMIEILITFGILVTAFLHAGFCIIEMFYWKKPLGRKIFKTEKEFATQSASLAANQGLYNAFLCVGLLWSLFMQDPTQSFHTKIFFLGCVIVAGVYAGITVSRRIIFIQAMPAFLTLILLFL